MAKRVPADGKVHGVVPANSVSGVIIETSSFTKKYGSQALRKLPKSIAIIRSDPSAAYMLGVRAENSSIYSANPGSRHRQPSGSRRSQAVSAPGRAHDA